MATSCPVAGCADLPVAVRHRHPTDDLRQLGETCACGANLWVILFGGPLPAIIACGNCSASFNITQRLRDCGREHSPGRPRVSDDQRYSGRDPQYGRRRGF